MRLSTFACLIVRNRDSSITFSCSLLYHKCSSRTRVNQTSDMNCWGQQHRNSGSWNRYCNVEKERGRTCKPTPTHRVCKLLKVESTRLPTCGHSTTTTRYTPKFCMGIFETYVCLLRSLSAHRGFFSPWGGGSLPTTRFRLEPLKSKYWYLISLVSRFGSQALTYARAPTARSLLLFPLCLSPSSPAYKHAHSPAPPPTLGGLQTGSPLRTMQAGGGNPRNPDSTARESEGRAVQNHVHDEQKKQK